MISPEAPARRVIETATGVRRRVRNLLWRSATTPRVPVYSRDWDVLIVLDACRPDALRTVAPEYDWLPDEIETAHSVAGTSRQWLRRNFRSEDYGAAMRSTAHVTWNPNTAEMLDAEEWGHLDEVWRDAWDHERSIVPPETVTDRALAAARSDPERLLVHYMQPHAPYPATPELDCLVPDVIEDAHRERVTIWERLQDDEISRAEAWEGYVDNLRWVLDDLPTLLAGIDDDARVVLTADHAECFGEHGLWGHPKDVMPPTLVTVPWVTVDPAGTRAARTAEAAPVSTPDGISVDERLTALGYRG